MRLSFFVCGIGVVLSVGCGDDDATSVDAGRATDGGGLDAGTMDAALDAALDAAGPDAAPIEDAGGLDADVTWSFCPPASTFVGGSGWTVPFSATDDAVYCATFDEGRTLRQELEHKAMLKVVAGTYSLPDVPESPDGGFPFLLPTCIRLADGGTIVSQSAGTLQAFGYYYSFSFGASTGSMGGTLTQSALDGGAPPFDLRGQPNDQYGSNLNFDMWQCPPSEPECYGGILGPRFDSCTLPTGRLNTHDVTLAGGSTVRFEIRIGDSPASTEPAVYERASGTFRGVAFDQRDYWKLVYNPEHHHFTRDFAVFFDAPIDGVCGIEVVNLEPYNDDLTADAAYAVDCALNRLSELDIESHAWTREEL